MIAGAGLCNEKTVSILVHEGPDRIYDLIELGTNFTRKDGKLDLAKEGGHSMPRIVHARDSTGQEIERALIESVNTKSNINVIENTLAIDLLTEHNANHLKEATLNNRNCWGAYVLICNQNKVERITSKTTVLATGGLGQVYLHTD